MTLTAVMVLCHDFEYEHVTRAAADTAVPIICSGSACNVQFDAVKHLIDDLDNFFFVVNSRLPLLVVKDDR
jgi:hypothetical protein